MYHLENKAYLSERVTEVNAFCLRLLLMCCGDLSLGEWESLMLADTLTAALSDEDDTVSLASINLGDHKGHVACGTFGCDEDAHEQRLADAADALRWEAKSDGVKYLGYHEMEQHNSLMSQCG
jgi:hypothetical protein